MNHSSNHHVLCLSLPDNNVLFTTNKNLLFYDPNRKAIYTDEGNLMVAIALTAKTTKDYKFRILIHNYSGQPICLHEFIFTNSNDQLSTQSYYTYLPSKKGDLYYITYDDDFSDKLTPDSRIIIEYLSPSSSYYKSTHEKIVQENIKSKYFEILQGTNNNQLKCLKDGLLTCISTKNDLPSNSNDPLSISINHTPLIASPINKLSDNIITNTYYRINIISEGDIITMKGNDNKKDNDNDSFIYFSRNTISEWVPLAYSFYSYGYLIDYKDTTIGSSSISGGGGKKDSLLDKYKLSVADTVYDSGKPVLSIERENILVKSEGITHIIIMIEFKDNTTDIIPITITGKQKQVLREKEIDKSFNYTFYCDCSVRNMYCIPYAFQAQSDCVVNVEIPFKYVDNVNYNNSIIQCLWNDYPCYEDDIYSTIESQDSNKLLSTTQLALALCTDILKIESLPDDTIKETLDRISEELDKSKPLDNFEQWSVWYNQTEELDISNIEVNSSSVNSQKGTSKNILKDDSNCWESLSKEDPSYSYIILFFNRWLTLTLPQPTVLSSLVLSFSKITSDNITPDELKIYTKNSNEGYVLRYKAKNPDNKLKGFNSKTISSHSIRYIQLYTPVSCNNDITTKSSKDLLIDIFSNILMNNNNEQLKLVAFETLIKFIISYGTYNGIATLLMYLKDLDRELTNEECNRLNTLFDEIKKHYNKVLSTKQQITLSRQVSLPSRAVFDSKISSNSHIKIKEGGREVWSDGSPCYAAVNKPMTNGVYKWEFVLFEDTNSECTCMGVCTIPVNDPNYEKTKDMWLIRCYNGKLYNGGEKSSKCDKIRKGDKVAFTLDLSIGMLSLSINGKEQPGKFDDLKGKTLYPCVQFYSGNRAVQLVSFHHTETSKDVTDTVLYKKIISKEGLEFSYDMESDECNDISCLFSDNNNNKNEGWFIYPVDHKYEEIELSYTIINNGIIDEEPKELNNDNGVIISIYNADDLDNPIQTSRTTMTNTNTSITTKISDYKNIKISIKLEKPIVDLESEKNDSIHVQIKSIRIFPLSPWTCNRCGYHNINMSLNCGLCKLNRFEKMNLENIKVENKSDIVNYVIKSLSDYLKRLSIHYMRFSSGLPQCLGGHFHTISIDHPYCIELSKSSINTTLLLIEHFCSKNGSSDIIENLISLLLAIIRLLKVANIDPKSVGLNDHDMKLISNRIHKLMKDYKKYEIPLNEIISLGGRLLDTNPKCYFCKYREMCINGCICEIQINLSLTEMTEREKNKLMRCLLSLQLKSNEMNLNYKIYPYWNNLSYIIADCENENIVNEFIDLIKTIFREIKFNEELEEKPKWKRRERFAYEGYLVNIRYYKRCNDTFQTICDSVKEILPNLKRTYN